MAFGHSRRRWFGTCSCKPVPRGLPSSVEQFHTSRPLRPSLRSWRTVVRVTAQAQPARLQFPIQQGLAARDSGKPRRCGVIISRSSSFAPWSFGHWLQRRYPPSSLLWPLLTSPSLSPRSSPQVRCCFFPFIPSGSTSHVSDGHGASLCLASLPPVRGLSAGSCSYGRRFVPRCLQLGSRRWPRDPPCGSLRLPPSVAVSTLQLTSKQPMLGTLGRAGPPRAPAQRLFVRVETEPASEPPALPTAAPLN